MPTFTRNLPSYWQDQDLARSLNQSLFENGHKRTFELISYDIMRQNLTGTRAEMQSIIDGTIRVKGIGPNRKAQLADNLPPVQ